MQVPIQPTNQTSNPLTTAIPDHRMGLRQTHDTRGTAAQTPTSPRKDAARTGPRANETRATGEEAGSRHQEEREERADGRGEGAGEGFGEDEAVHHQVLSDADAVAGDKSEDTGELWDCGGGDGVGWHANGLLVQTVRSNEQMMQSMKGATQLLGSMNRQMNLPALQRIAMEFEKENDIMDQRQEMMDDAIDDVTGLEDEEEGEEVVNQVLDEIGVDLGQSVSLFYYKYMDLCIC